MKKTTRCCIIGFSSVLILGAIGATTYFLIESFSNQSKPRTHNVFNDVVSDLSNLEDPFDKATLDYYKTNTATLYSENPRAQYGSMGTIWNYPTPINGDRNRHYFATNIHVVSDALLWRDNAQKFDINNTINFLSKTENSGNCLRLWDVEVEKINAYNQLRDVSPNFKIDSYYEQNKWYSDFVILSTITNIFSNSNGVQGVDGLNFLDTDAEYNWLVNSLNKPTDLEFYICGYPDNGWASWPSSAAWTTAKYIWKESDSSNRKPELSSSSISLQDNYLKPDSVGFQIGNGSNKYKNYTKQLLLPKLNLGGGSSGSLVTVKYTNPNTNKAELLALGAYWGGYSYRVNEEEGFIGALDLFYTPQNTLISSDPHFLLDYNNLLK